MHTSGQHGCRNALNRFPDQTPHSSWYEEAEKHIPRCATTKEINPKLNSATDPRLRSATPMLTQRQQQSCTRRAVINFSIGGREAIRQYFIVRGGSIMSSISIPTNISITTMIITIISTIKELILLLGLVFLLSLSLLLL